MSDFKREDRYTVIKHNQLTGYQVGHLKDFLLGEGVPTVKGVVIESDWPEYEPVWQMIERRMSGQPDHVGVVVAKKWLEGAPRAVSLVNGSGLPDGAYLYLAPPASSDLAEITLKILKEAKDIPDGLYARAKHLANTEQSQLAALREELAQWKHMVGAVGATIPLGKTLESLSTKQTMTDYFKALHAERDELQQRLADAERRNVQLSESSSAYLNLRERIRAMGTPPHSDYWHQSIHVAESDLRAALNPNPEAASQVGRCTFDEPCKCKTDKEKIWCGAWVEDEASE